MALVNEKVSTSSGGAAPQGPVSVHVESGNYAVMYTVPAGRKFSGFFSYTSASYTELARINDVGIYARTDNFQPMVEMVAGDVFKAGSSTTLLHGVERDDT